jgi:phage tail-like protein
MMDVNGTKFHLLYGQDDWESCLLADRGLPLSCVEDDTSPIEWASDGNQGYLRLARESILFQRAKVSSDTVPQTENRRGAARDRYGNWYWINEDETAICLQAAGQTESVLYWRSDLPPVPPPPSTGDFTSQPIPPVYGEVLKLRGLAITTQNYLVVGVDGRGLHIFDLYHSSTPEALDWPRDKQATFAPWDIAAAPDGGLFVLDRDHKRYWRLDSRLKLDDPAAADSAFTPVGQPQPAPPPESARNNGFRLLIEGNPVSIEANAAGHALVLVTSPTAASVIYEYDDGQQLGRYSLENFISVDDPETGATNPLSLEAYDFAYLDYGATCLPRWLDIPVTKGEIVPVLLVAEKQGNQVIAFKIKDDHKLDTLADYLPLHRTQGRGLVTEGCRVYYDSNQRWTPLQRFDSQQMAHRAVITTPTDFQNGYATQPFDGEVYGCVWHRLLLDAVIPMSTSITIRARAADDPVLLTQLQWRDQPIPYLRTNGSELPYFTQPDFRAPDPANAAPAVNENEPDLPQKEKLLAERMGTWELLFQEIRGRYLQLEITLEGTGRASPRLYALRAWYPRFSYLENYLPAVYREEPISASFLDRWLAIFEGLFTEIEDKIVLWRSLIDPRIAPADALDWLAGWLGLTMDPMWKEHQRRFFIRHAVEFYRLRGTPHGLAVALRLYLDDRISETMFAPSPQNESRVRITENFMTFAEDLQRAGNQYTPADFQAARHASAHRFRLLVPRALPQTKAAMIERIVNLEKPAHTRFTIERYDDGMIVGQMRLGMDTRLCGQSSIDPFYLGETLLARGYLASHSPSEAQGRIILDRGALGQ